jgi:hypothetical protein
MSTAAAPASTAHASTRPAITGEAGLRHARTVRAAIVFGRDFDVLVLLAPLPVAILDPQIGEVDLFIEVRQLVLAGPRLDLFVGPIGAAVGIGAVAIPFVKPRLVLTLELVVERDAIDVRPSLAQALRGAFRGAIDLVVVFALALAFEAMPERLAVTWLTIAMVFEEAPSFLRQRDRILARTWHPRDLDELLLAEVAQVARPRIERPIMAVAEITTGDHSKCPDGRERARFRSTQRVFAIAIPHALTFESARQIEMPGKYVARIVVERPVVAVALRLPQVVYCLLNTTPIPRERSVSSMQTTP